MMDTFGIPLAFVIIAALTLWVVVGSRGWWWVKGCVVAIAIFFSISLWHSLGGLEGWPTDQPLPEKFEIKWIVIEEPNKKTGSKGRILVLAKNLNPELKNKSRIPLLHSKDKSNEPRIHELPYSRELHKQSIQIQKKIAAGGKFYGEMKARGKGLKGKGEGKGKGKGQGRGRDGQGKNGNGRSGGSLSNEQDPIFHELPPPYFPPKSGG